MSGGSAERAAEMAARAFLEAGRTNLESKIGAHVASFGANCFQTDVTVQGMIRRPDGKSYHRESIGRARRNLAAAGLMHSSRVHVGEMPKAVNGVAARFRSAHGTTNKWINWAKLGIKNPVSRAEARAAQRVNRPRATGSTMDPTRGPSYVSAAAVSVATAPGPVDPGLAAVMARAGASLERRWEAADERQNQAALDAVRLDLERRRGPPG